MDPNLSLRTKNIETTGKFRSLNRVWYAIFIAFSTGGVFVAINQIFHLEVFGVTLVLNQYLYVLLLLYLSFTFIIFPASKTAPRNSVPWYDVILFLVTIGCSAYLGAKALDIDTKGWAWVAPLVPTVVSFIIWLLALEAGRRTGKLVLFALCLIFSLYPIFADHMPGFLWGAAFPWPETARNYVMGYEALLGIPLRVVGTLIIGFLIFGVAMMHTGGAKFFLNLAFALFGSRRGGPAKVAIVASSLFGSMSGSPISNVLATGSVTIPTMKRMGYPSQYAGAVEACASTGGALMPPIMGAAGFIMASFLNIEYWQVAIAAAIPSVMYYFSLFMQTDARAVKLGLKGIPKNERPMLKQTLKEGWVYLFAFFILVYLLFYLRYEAQAPFYATAFLLIVTNLRKETRFNISKLLEFIASMGRMIVEITAMLTAVGLIIGALSITGLAHAFSRELVLLAGGNVLLLLIFGAITSFVLGTGMTMSACYVFLAIVLAPALVKIGINPIAAHLFVMYWGIISNITPPVCLTAYAAATIAEAEPMRTGFQATRLGIVIYIVPFLFVFSPGLVAQAPILEILWVVATALVGVILIAAAVEGYLVGLGRLIIPLRILSLASGILLALPNWQFVVMGLGIATAIILVSLYTKKVRAKRVLSGC